MGGIHAFQVAQVVPPSGKKYFFVVSLDLSICHLPVDMTCVGGSETIYRQ